MKKNETKTEGWVENCGGIKPIVLVDPPKETTKEEK